MKIAKILCLLIFMISFTPLEKAAEFIQRSLPYKADGGLMPPSAYTVRERSSLTGFTAIVIAQDIQESKCGAKIIETKGEAFVKYFKEKNWIAVKKGMILKEGGIIKTGNNSTVVIQLFKEGQETAIVEIKNNSQLLIAEISKTDKKNTEHTLLDLAIGKILVKAQKLHGEKSKFEVKTPTSIAGVRGTTFTVEVAGLK